LVTMAIHRGPGFDLVGRQTECRLVAEHLSQTRQGRGGALVVTGDPGTGKTALLNFAAASAPDLRVIRLSGTESERFVSYAGLHRLADLLAEHVAQLRPAQRAALELGFGERIGPPPARLVVSVATVSLLTAAARDRAVICAVDDLHWLDQASAQALVFGPVIASVVAKAVVVLRFFGWILAGKHGVGFRAGSPLRRQVSAPARR